ncbi:hypothetical protein TNCV_1095021 [Trichonephila clavipes]|nr:hypothetical protein TNCV_1095021 [Trichonephila clavipes]
MLTLQRTARIFRPTRGFNDHTEFFPDGHGYELVSSVRALVTQKLKVEEELMYLKHVEVKSPHVGVMWKIGRELSAQVSSSSLNRGSKLRSRSSVATVLT